jgi:hypothetical protein
MSRGSPNLGLVRQFGANGPESKGFQIAAPGEDRREARSPP